MGIVVTFFETTKYTEVEVLQTGSMSIIFLVGAVFPFIDKSIGFFKKFQSVTLLLTHSFYSDKLLLP